MGKPRKCLTGTLIYSFVLLLLFFIIIFIVVPLVFKYSIDFQRAVIFPTWASETANFSDVKSFGLQGVRNFYVTVDEKENVTLGAWQILPRQALSDAVSDNQYYNYEDILANRNYSVLLYLHGNGGVRSVPLQLYSILRRFFHVIAVDYRGYADSTKAELTEDNIVKDIVVFYKWVKERTKARIFIWGHSLGTGVGTHTVSNLKAEDIVPSGLILETPFSTILDVMERHFFIKLLSWLPWYRSTMLDPVTNNGFGFESTKYILDVDCPVMILHAKDDSVVPYDLATKLYETAVNSRNYTTQGNITYHLFGPKGYDHMFIYRAPELPKYIRTFVDECILFENRSLNTTSLN